MFDISGLDDTVDETAGVNGGTKFTDVPPPDVLISAIRVWVDGENHVSGIQMEYGGVWGKSHGGTRGKKFEVTLGGEEKLEEVDGSIGEKGIESLKFIGSKSDYGPYGGEVAESKFASAKPGCYVIYISGKVDNDRIDSLDFHYKCPI